MPAIEYHFVIALNGTVGPSGVHASAGAHGLITRDPAETTRIEVLNQLIEDLRTSFLERTGQLLENWTITNFQLAPKALD
ncbi:hypothetical protein [Streptomyces sp. NBC_00470]|uniref:hypothetical protein n=1 Tax=Streptomyces sp. NBC_00470 TaxID=2975753 RepID=UPI002F9136D9